jgi:hypothetical protein
MYTLPSAAVPTPHALLALGLSSPMVPQSRCQSNVPSGVNFTRKASVQKKLVVSPAR